MIIPAKPVVADAAGSTEDVEVGSGGAAGGALLGRAARQLGKGLQLFLRDPVWFDEGGLKCKPLDVELAYRIDEQKKNPKQTCCVDGALLPSCQRPLEDGQRAVHVVGGTRNLSSLSGGLLEDAQDVGRRGHLSPHTIDAPEKRVHNSSTLWSVMVLSRPGHVQVEVVKLELLHSFL